MKGTFFDNLDIDLYLTQLEFDTISQQEIKIVNKKLKKKFESLECMLQKMDGSDSRRKAHIQCEDFEDMGDGIKVKYKEGTYFIKMNEHASEIIDERGHFGTRYGMGEKITIYISERMQRPF